MQVAHLIGRLMFGLFFIYNGVGHFLRYKAMAGYAASKGIPFSGIAVVITGILLVLGGSSLLLAFRPEVGIALLALFLLPVTLTMHNFWAVADPGARMIEMVNFTKNLALLGALLSLLGLPRPWPFALFR
ncbi:MAG: DoxX family membrane protein [candidate division KSB1 bacterium]|nr:DoxX family membrane protein [candidate division KSB1 bacterium]